MDITHSLPNEITFKILDLLSDRDKINFTSCSKRLRELVYHLRFKTPVYFDDIKKLSYFDSFTTVKYIGPKLKPSNIKFPSCIEEIYVKSDKFIPRDNIRFQKISIDCLGGEETEQMLISASELLNDRYTCLLRIDLSCIRCEEMEIVTNIFATSMFSSSLRPKMTFNYYVVLPITLRVLHCYDDLTIGELIPENLEELVCRGELNIQNSWRGLKNITVFKVHYITDRTQDFLSLHYKDMKKLKTLVVPFISKIDFGYFENLEELEILIYNPSDKITCFPPRLKKLHIMYCDEYEDYSQEIPDLPETLNEFLFKSASYDYNIPLPELPSGLEILKLEVNINRKIKYFPKNIVKLTLNSYEYKIDFSNLPKLKVLKLGFYKFNLNNLCEGLEKLKFADCNKYNKNIILPSTVKKLWLPDSFNRKIDLPDSLEEILFNDEFNQEVNLPSRLIRVRFGNCFNKEVDLPDSLEEISFGKGFRKSIERLPSNLKKLRIPACYKDHLPPLPETLKEIDFFD
jgi:hypothetical protein